MNKIFSFLEKNIILLVGFFFIIPFVFISYFNNPSSDDYCFATQVKELGYWAAQKATYNGWTGRYFSTAILSLNIVEEKNIIWYKIFPVLLIFSMLISVFFFVREVFKSKSVGFNLEITLLIFLLYLTQMPIISEGLYWWAGAITYQLANIFTFVLLRSIIIVLRKKSVWNVIFGSLVGFFIAGLNETSMFLLNVLLILILISNYYTKKKLNIQVFIIFTVLLISSIIVVIAPGNNVRGGFFPNQHKFFFSLVLTSFDTLRYISRWLGLTFLVSLICYAKLLKDKNTEFIQSKFKVSNKIALMISFVVIFAGFFIGFWTMGKPIPVRSVNTVYVFFTVGFMYLILNFLIQLKVNLDTYFKNKTLLILLMMISFSIMFDKKNIINVIDDLGKKTAYNYNIEIKDRILKTKSTPKGAELILKPIMYRPVTLLEVDLEYDSNYFANVCYANYWGMKKVISKHN